MIARLKRMMVQTSRLFLLGAGFSRPAGLPLASELLTLVEDVSRQYLRVGEFSHLEHAIDEYRAYLADTAPGRAFDLEEFGAWLDWEHVLRLKGSDTFSQYGNQAGLQLRWAIGKVLFDAMPEAIPDLYLEFAKRLTVTDRILTLNYDILLERALDEVGLPYRRFPHRYSEVGDLSAATDLDHPQELVVSKLHGSIDWTFAVDEDPLDLQLQPLLEGPTFVDDPLRRVAVVPRSRLQRYYAQPNAWFRNPPNLFPPSTAKPLAGSTLIPIWDGVGLFAYMLGGFSVIGCSLPPGDPYVVQLVHHVATDYVAGRKAGDGLVPQHRMKVVTLCEDDECKQKTYSRFRFFDLSHTDFAFEGFSSATLGQLFDVSV